jgi:molecular chaperone GrpE
VSDLDTQSTPDSRPSDDSEGGGNPLESKIQELEAQLKEKEQKYVYLYADFENYKKRVIKERSDLLKFGWEASARQLLEVIDNLERALAHMPKSNEPANKTLEDGLKMVLNQFKAVLEKQGVQHIAAEGKPFDPNLHEAIGQEKSEHPEGHIVRDEMKGYTIHGRLLRPSRVIVSGGASH